MDFKTRVQLEQKYGSLDAAREAMKGQSGIIDGFGNVITYDTLKGYTKDFTAVNENTGEKSTIKGVQLSDEDLDEAKKTGNLYKVGNMFTSKSAGVYRDPTTGKVSIYAPKIVTENSDALKNLYDNSKGLLAAYAANPKGTYIGGDGDTHNLSDGVKSISKQLNEISNEYEYYMSQREALASKYGISNTTDDEIGRSLAYANDKMKDSSAVPVMSESSLKLGTAGKFGEAVLSADSYDSEKNYISYGDFKKIMDNLSQEDKVNAMRGIAAYLSTANTNSAQEITNDDGSKTIWADGYYNTDSDESKSNRNDLFGAISLYKSLANNSGQLSLIDQVGASIQGASYGALMGAADLIDQVEDVGANILAIPVYILGLGVSNIDSQYGDVDSVKNVWGNSLLREGLGLGELAQNSVNNAFYGSADRSVYDFEFDSTGITSNTELGKQTMAIAQYADINPVGFSSGYQFGYTAFNIAKTMGLQKILLDPLGKTFGESISGLLSGVDGASKVIEGAGIASKLIVGSVALGLSLPNIVNNFKDGNWLGGISSAYFSYMMTTNAMYAPGGTTGDLMALVGNVGLQSTVETIISDRGLESLYDGKWDELMNNFGLNIVYNYVGEKSGIGSDTRASVAMGNYGAYEDEGVRATTRIANAIASSKYSAQAKIAEMVTKLVPGLGDERSAKEIQQTKALAQASSNIAKSADTAEALKTAILEKIELENSYARLRASGLIDYQEMMNDKSVKPEYEKLSKTHNDLTKYLISKGADVDKLASEGYTYGKEANTYMGYKIQSDMWLAKANGDINNKNYVEAINSMNAAKNAVVAIYGDAAISKLDDVVRDARALEYKTQLYADNHGVSDEARARAVETGWWGPNGELFLPLVRIIPEKGQSNVTKIQELVKAQEEGNFTKINTELEMKEMGDEIDTTHDFADIYMTMNAKWRMIGTAIATQNRAQALHDIYIAGGAQKLEEAGMKAKGISEEKYEASKRVSKETLQKTQGVINENLKKITKTTIGKDVSNTSIEGSELHDKAVAVWDAIKQLDNSFKEEISEGTPLTKKVSDIKVNVTEKTNFLARMDYQVAEQVGIAEKFGLLNFDRTFRTKAEFLDFSSNFSKEQMDIFKDAMTSNGIIDPVSMRRQVAAKYLPSTAKNLSFEDVVAIDGFKPTNPDFGKAEIARARKTGETTVYIVGGGKVEGTNAVKVYTSISQARKYADAPVSKKALDKFEADFKKHLSKVRDNRVTSFAGEYVMAFEKAAEKYNAAVNGEISLLGRELSKQQTYLDDAKKFEEIISRSDAPKKGDIWDFSKKITKDNFKYLDEESGEEALAKDIESINSKAETALSKLRKSHDETSEKIKTQTGKRLENSKAKLSKIEADIKSVESERDADVKALQDMVADAKADLDNAKKKMDAKYKKALEDMALPKSSAEVELGEDAPKRRSNLEFATGQIKVSQEAYDKWHVSNWKEVLANEQAKIKESHSKKLSDLIEKRKQQSSIARKETGKNRDKAYDELDKINKLIKKEEASMNAELAAVNSEATTTRERLLKARDKANAQYEKDIAEYKKKKAKEASKTAGERVPVYTGQLSSDIQKNVDDLSEKIDTLKTQIIKIDGTPLKDAGSDIGGAYDYILENVPREIEKAASEYMTKGQRTKMRKAAAADEIYEKSFDEEAAVKEDIEKEEFSFGEEAEKRYGVKFSKPSSLGLHPKRVKLDDVSWDSDAVGYLIKGDDINKVIAGETGDIRAGVEDLNSKKVTIWNKIVKQDPDFVTRMFQSDVNTKCADTIRNSKDYDDTVKEYLIGKRLGDDYFRYREYIENLPKVREKQKQLYESTKGMYDRATKTDSGRLKEVPVSGASTRFHKDGTYTETSAFNVPKIENVPTSVESAIRPESYGTVDYKPSSPEEYAFSAKTHLDKFNKLVEKRASWEKAGWKDDLGNSVTNRESSAGDMYSASKLEKLEDDIAKEYNLYVDSVNRGKLYQTGGDSESQSKSVDAIDDDTVLAAIREFNDGVDLATDNITNYIGAKVLNNTEISKDVITALKASGFSEEDAIKYMVLDSIAPKDNKFKTYDSALKAKNQTNEKLVATAVKEIIDEDARATLKEFKLLEADLNKLKDDPSAKKTQAYKDKQKKLRVVSDRLTEIRKFRQGSHIYNSIMENMQSKHDSYVAMLKGMGRTDLVDMDSYRATIKAQHKAIYEEAGRTYYDGGRNVVLNVNGSREIWEVNDNMLPALTSGRGGDNSPQSKLLQFSKLGQRGFRAGTTGALAPSSLISQWMKDPVSLYIGSGSIAFRNGTMSSFIGSDVTSVMGKEMVDRVAPKILENIRQNSPEYADQIIKEAKESGLDLNQYVIDTELYSHRDIVINSTMLENEFFRDIKKTTEGHYNSLKGKSPETINDKINKATDAINETRLKYLNVENYGAARESYLRSNAYNDVFSSAISNGCSIKEARQYAEFYARTATTNFDRSLLFGNKIADAVPYLSAAINGSKSFWRLFELDPVGVSSRIGTMYFMYMNLVEESLADDENKKVYDQLREYQKDGNIIWVENGVGFNIPVPEEVATFLNVARWSAESAFGSNKNTQLQLITNSILSVSPVNLTGFMDLDRNNIGTGDYDLWSNMDVGLGKMFSQISGPLAKTAFSIYTGIDPFTGEKIDNSYWTEDENGRAVKVDNTQGRLAKLLSSIAPEDWNLSASAVEHILKNIFGKSGREDIESMASILSGDVTGGVSRFASQVISPLSVNVYDRMRSDRISLVSEAYREKDALMKNDRFREQMSLYNKYRQSGETEKARVAYGEVKTMVQEFQSNILNKVKELQALYGADIYTNNFQASIISLMTFDDDMSLTPVDSYSSTESGTSEHYAARDLAIQSMVDAGFPDIQTSGADLSILGYGYYYNGEYKYAYANPVSILAAEMNESSVSRITTDRIKTKMVSTGLDQVRKNMNDQVTEMFDSIKGKKMTSKDWQSFNDSIDKIYAQYDSRVFLEVIFPTFMELENAGQNVSSYISYNIDDFDNLVKVPYAYMGKGKYDSKISKQKAYVKSYIEDMYNSYKKKLKGGK